MPQRRMKSIATKGMLIRLATAQARKEIYRHRLAVSGPERGDTRRLRDELFSELSGFADWTVVPGSANFFLCHLPINGPHAATFVRRRRARGLFLRNPGPMGRH